ncbi:MAG TPA: POTRA domain-containing protein [Candidatus Acidoferrales bacterium]|nr:POTRA domain-containing protein [Candidatus Acidoferrales bacterium]
MNLLRANSLRVLMLLVPLLGGTSACAQQAAEEKAQTPVAANVQEVRVVEENGKVLKTNPPGIAIKPGAPVTVDAVAASIRTLYQTGDYSDIKALETPVANGIRLDFVIRENLFFNQIVVEGLKPPPTEASATGAMQLSLGQTYHPTDLEEAIARLKDTLQDEGLYKAKVTVEPKPSPETHQMDVIVHVVPGPRVHLSKVELQNNTEYSDADLLKLFKLKPGSELTIARGQSAAGRIRKFLEKKGHLSDRVALRRGEYDTATNSISLTLDVIAGPMVRLAVEGAKFSRRDLRKLIPIYQEASVDADLLEEGKRNLREKLEREGFFDAAVDYTLSESTVKSANSDLQLQEEVITYKVNRGIRYTGLRIEITGNHYFNKQLLMSRLSISTSALFVKPRFSQRLLDSDVASMKNLYAANGFLAAVVTAKTSEEKKKSGELVVRFDINEGKQTLVSSLKLEGMKAISEEELRGVLGSLPGQPYSEISIASDRDNILALYFSKGYPNANFTWAAAPDIAKEPEDAGAKKPENAGKGKGSSVDTSATGIERAEPVKLTYTIQEGERVTVHQVLLSGYKHTRRRVIKRQVKVVAGEPLREGDVVESQQKLYNLGIFNRVTIDTQNANGTDPDKDVVVLVEEAKRYTIAYGGGFEVQRLASTTNPTGGEVEAAPRGIFEISKENLTGRADALSLKIRGSTIQGRALLAYTSPETFNKDNLSLQVTAYVEKSQDINTFTQTRYEGNIQITDRLTPRSSLLLRYAFRKVTLSNLNVPEEEVPLFYQPTLVSEFSASWFRDTRDNPADATKGSFNTADFSVAGTALGSSASFLRLFLQNSTYHKISRNWSFARSTRLGILEPYASTQTLSFPAQTGTPSPQLIPLPERLFAGGGTSLRGFALNQAGPRDALTGFPVGGQAMLILNQELRFPLKLPVIGTSLGGAFFYDGGNVYSRLDRITLRWTSPEPIFKAAYPGLPPGRFNPTLCEYNCTNELNYFSNTVGFGLRYATPIGPIRIDLGYELNQPQFVIPCKDNVALCQQGTRLPKFQIFFNLGSSF